MANFQPQVASLSSKGSSVAAVNSNCSKAVKSGVFRGVTPEALLQGKKMERSINYHYIFTKSRGLLDEEAHCVKKMEAD